MSQKIKILIPILFFIISLTIIFFFLFFFKKNKTLVELVKEPVVLDIETIIEENLFPNDLSQDGISNEEKIALGLDPTEYDTDRDGLSDWYEINVSGTDPLNPDTDGDGLTDGQEVLIFGTDPLNPDTDGDGFPDGQEVEAGFSPLCAGPVLLFEPCPEN
jgi:hypothetical protein